MVKVHRCAVVALVSFSFLHFDLRTVFDGVGGGSHFFSGQLLRTSLPLLLPQTHTYIPLEILLWKLACLCLGLQGRKGRSDENIMKIKRK